jgi:glycosyltransferase involved in cell wall biosynthesis
VELDLIERVPNEEALRRVAEADVYVDQLVAGYAFAALEAMALGKVVLSPTAGDWTYEVFRRYSYLDECPILNVSPETIEAVLADLIGRRQEWPALGRAGRSYCERRHSMAANAEMWEAILGRVWMKEDVNLMDLFNPATERARP